MRVAVLVLGTLAAACHGGEPAARVDSAPAPVVDASNIVDDRVPIPAPDPSFLDLVGPDEIVQPGENKMFCAHFENTGDLLAIDAFAGMEGNFGHHVDLFLTTDPKPAGTVEDCTSAEANAKLTWYVFNTTFPAGLAVAMPPGQHYVLQYHYINASDNPILVNAVGRAHHVDPATITTWTSTMMTSDLTVSLPIGQTQSTWDCALPSDRDLLVLFGHMHEYGTEIDIGLGSSADAVQTMYSISPWSSAFRDNPPANDYFDAPIHLAAGSILRTTCTWLNTTNEPIVYPNEMCMTFAYVANASGGSYQCNKPGSPSP